ncbi:uncharacterized protein LOC143847114 [Tasmannia lanceolata]|uniref:uncharacterized protein LOC143847114 n=1 Tax=Tasmannia lanceolata TaxID=3420 RepID=UPI004064AAA9
MGCMLAQQDPESKRERAIYFISKKMLEYEQKYTILEKTCLALVWATQKLRHYLLSNRVLLLSRMDPLKYLFEKQPSPGELPEYEACIAGLEAAMALHFQDLDVFGDSILIICQTNGNWKTRDDKLIPYNTYLESLVRKFGNITIHSFVQNEESLCGCISYSGFDA